MIQPALFDRIYEAREKLRAAIHHVRVAMEIHGQHVQKSTEAKTAEHGDAFALGELMSAMGMMIAAEEPLGSFLEREANDNIRA